MKSAETVWDCPDGTLVLTSDAPRAEWLAARRRGIGGSDLAALFHEAKYDATEYSVWLDKTGRGMEVEQTEAMEWGTRFEDAIAEKFGDDTGIGSIRAGLMRSKVEPLLLASVDRLTDDDGGLECKNQNQFMKKEYFGPNGEEVIPRQFYWQMVAYLAVTGRSHWWLAALIGGQNLVIRRLDRADCEDDIARALSTVGQWWQRYVIEDEAPEFGQPTEALEVDPNAKIEASVPGLVWEMVQRWRTLRQEAKDIKAELEQIKAEIKAEHGTAKILTVRGIPVTQMITKNGSGRFNRKAFEKAHPELVDEIAKYVSGGGKGSTQYPILIGADDSDE